METLKDVFINGFKNGITDFFKPLLHPVISYKELRQEVQQIIDSILKKGN